MTLAGIGLMQSKPQMSKPARPLGVTILAVIAILGGVFGLLGGVVAIMPNSTEPYWLGLTILAYSVLLIALGAGYLRGRLWAWLTGVGLYVIALPLGVIEILYAGTGAVGGVIRIIVSAPILYYLTRPRVRAFFGRTGATSSPRSAG